MAVKKKASVAAKKKASQWWVGDSGFQIAVSLMFGEVPISEHERNSVILRV